MTRIVRITIRCWGEAGSLGPVLAAVADQAGATLLTLDRRAPHTTVTVAVARADERPDELLAIDFAQALRRTGDGRCVHATGVRLADPAPDPDPSRP